MAVPYRVAGEIAELGLAGFLRIEQKGAIFRGALFMINCHGEPEEFTYTSVQIPGTFLWNKNEIARSAARRVVTSLFSLCPQAPRLIFCLGAEIGSHIFCEEIETEVPTCRIIPGAEGCRPHEKETQQNVPRHPGLQLLWCPSPPAKGSMEARLLEKLSERDLLIEPFERILKGLAEVFDKSEP